MGKAKGTMSPKEVRRIRVKLGLSQRRAGILLGGGIQAFHRYEKGEICASHSMSNLLRVLDESPGLLETIRLAEKAESESYAQAMAS